MGDRVGRKFDREIRHRLLLLDRRRVAWIANLHAIDNRQKVAAGRRVTGEKRGSSRREGMIGSPPKDLPRERPGVNEANVLSPPTSSDSVIDATTARWAGKTRPQRRPLAGHPAPSCKVTRIGFRLELLRRKGTAPREKAALPARTGQLHDSIDCRFYPATPFPQSS